MTPLIDRLGWMLIHSAWEDLLIWAVLQFALAALARRSAHERYLAACAALIAMAIVPWLTFDASDLHGRMQAAHAAPSQATVSYSPATAAPKVPLAVISTPAPLPETGPEHRPGGILLSLLVAAWIAGLVVFSARLLFQWLRLRRLMRAPLRALPDPWPQRLLELQQLAGVRRFVRLAESAAIGVPGVVGWLKPVILLPLGIAMSLPAEQVETILLHELAHIARHDYLVNLLQRVIETVFFYHPAVWSVSHRIRRERERACDDQAVRWSRNPRAYAEALAAFEEYRNDAPLLAATGGDLLSRIERVLGVAGVERRSTRLVAAAGICGVGLYLASMLLTPILAAHVMSASERVAKIKAMQPPAEVSQTVASGSNIPISGTIRAEDGPLPLDATKHAVAIISTRKEGWSASLSFNFGLNLRENYFGTAVPAGRIGLGIWVIDYAPLRLNNLQPKDGKISLALVLRHGIPGRVRVTGTDGKPIAGAKVLAISNDSDSQIGMRAPEVQTDKSGEAVFGHVQADSEIHLTVIKPGWAMTDFVVSSWNAATPSELQLSPAASMSGIAVDQVTHRPIAHASIILAAVETSDVLRNRGYDPASGPLLAHTDQAGRFEVNTLNRENAYQAYIIAPGYSTRSYRLLDGDRNKIFEVAPGLRIRGRLLDPNSSLKEVYQPQLRADYTLQATSQQGYGQDKYFPLTKLGPEIPFEFDDLPAGRIDILVGGRWHSVDLQKNIDDLVINLADGSGESAENPPQPVTRKISIRLVAPAGSPPATGRLDLEYTCPSRGQNVMMSMTAEVKNGVAVADLPVPCDVTMRGAQLDGYWFPREQFSVPVGKDVMQREVKIQPAGIIHGTVTSDGDLGARPYFVDVRRLDPPSPGENGSDMSLSGRASHPLGGQYVTPSVPLGHAYVAVLWSFPTIFVSEPARVDAEHPIVQRDLHLVANDTLRGRLLDEHHKPIPFTNISLDYHPAANVPGFFGSAGITRRDGTFTISHMNFAVPGYYEIGVDGYGKPAMHIDGHTLQPVEVVVPPEKAASAVAPAATEAWDITGTIVDDAGRPVRGASVRFHSCKGRAGLPPNYAQTAEAQIDKPRMSRQFSLVGVSDEQGRFVIHDVAHSLIDDLVVTAPGHGPAFADDVDPKAGPVRIKLARLKPGQAGGEARGRVVDPDGRPLAGVPIMHFSYSHGDGTFYDGGVGAVIVPEATTDAQGEFSLPFRTGYEGVGVEVFAPGFARKMFPHLPYNNTVQELRLERGTTVTGRLMKDGAPLANRQIGLAQTNDLSETYLGELTAMTDGEGRFVFKDVVADAELEVYAKRDSLGMLGVPERKVIHTGKPDSSVSAGDLGVMPGTVISGRVVFSDGKTPHLGRPVQLHVGRPTTSDYQFIDLPPNNTFRLLVRDGETLHLSAWIPGYHQSGKEGVQEVRVEAGMKPIEMVFVPGDEVTGKSPGESSSETVPFLSTPETDGVGVSG